MVTKLLYCLCENRTKYLCFGCSVEQAGLEKIGQCFNYCTCTWCSVSWVTNFTLATVAFLKTQTNSWIWRSLYICYWFTKTKFIFDACDVTLSVYPLRASLKNMPVHGGNLTYDLWNTSLMLCRLSYAVR